MYQKLNKEEDFIESVIFDEDQKDISIDESIILALDSLCKYYSSFQKSAIKLTAEILCLYVEALRNFDITQISRAISSHIKDPVSGPFFPKIADLNRYLEGDVGGAAYAAWQKVEKAIRNIGPYESVSFDDPAIIMTIESLGGWINMCSISDDDLKFKCNHFMKAYKSIKNSGKNAENGYLIGLSAKSCISHQQKIPDIFIVGDYGATRDNIKKGLSQNNKARTFSIKNIENLIEKDI